MAFLALLNAHAMRTNLSMTITRMVATNKSDQNHSLWIQSAAVCTAEADDLEFDSKALQLQNSLDDYHFFGASEMHSHFQWSQEMQGIILSSFYWGYVLAHLPGGLLAQKYGGKYILAFGIFFSGVLSLLIPVCVNSGGAHSLIAIRVLMGICQGPIIPACMHLFSSWIPLRERCTMLSLMYSGISVSSQFHSNATLDISPQHFLFTISQVGIIAGTSISAFLLHVTHNWHSVFYFFGTMSIVWFFLFVSNRFQIQRDIKHPSDRIFPFNWT